MNRSKLLAPVVGFVLTMLAIAGVALLVGQIDSSREAQLQSNSVTSSLAELQSAPFNADPATGGSATASRTAIQTDEGLISRGLTVRANAGVAPALLAAGRADLAKIEPVVTRIYRISLDRGGLAGAGSLVPKLSGALNVHAAALSGVLAKISQTDAARAERAGAQATLGEAGAMLVLLVAFVYFYIRSVASHEAVERLAHEKGYEARTDALTKLGNRRALTRDLAGAIAEQSGSGELLLVMFDLDGFKQYNDTFGHAAGDALLQHLCGRLATAAREHSGSAYRMGGDEFCLLARCSPDNAERLLDDTIAALQDGGDGWDVGCSQGAAWIPSEAANENQALNLADERMYANKAGRSSAGRQVTDALLQVVTEQNVALDDHVERVAELCSAVAQALGQPVHEVRLIHLTARLHDIGKTAIPAAILDKPGRLDEQEWEFMCRHSLIGERIVMAAPALANCAPLIRSSHERIDGQGYPDGLTGPDIPLGSRIIAVCDAFDAMTSDRLYRPAISTEAAIEQLKRNAGTQFDATIVKAFCTVNSLRASSGGEPHVSTHDLVTSAIMPTTDHSSAQESYESQPAT